MLSHVRAGFLDLSEYLQCCQPCFAEAMFVYEPFEVIDFEQLKRNVWYNEKKLSELS
jgi:hypothetical protein